MEIFQSVRETITGKDRPVANGHSHSAKPAIGEPDALSLDATQLDDVDLLEEPGAPRQEKTPETLNDKRKDEATKGDAADALADNESMDLDDSIAETQDDAANSGTESEDLNLDTAPKATTESAVSDAANKEPETTDTDTASKDAPTLSATTKQDISARKRSGGKVSGKRRIKPTVTTRATEAAEQRPTRQKKTLPAKSNSSPLKRRLKSTPAKKTTPSSTNAEKPRKKRRYKPDTVARREIMRAVRSVEPCIRRVPFMRLVREIAAKYKADLRFKPSAITALQNAAEAHVICLLANTNEITRHGKRVIIQPKDMQIAGKIMQSQEI